MPRRSGAIGPAGCGAGGRPVPVQILACAPLAAPSIRRHLVGAALPVISGAAEATPQAHPVAGLGNGLARPERMAQQPRTRRIRRRGFLEEERISVEPRALKEAFAARDLSRRT